MFSKEIYVRRREHLMGRLDGGLALLLGNSESPMNYAENWYPFRQDSTFLYYIGLDQPDLAAVIDLDEGSTTVFGDELTIDHIVWMGNLPTIAERAERVGVSRTSPMDRLGPVVREAAAAGRPVRFTPPYRKENAYRLFELMGIAIAEAEERASLELIKAIIDQRAVKAEEEIDQLEKAATTSVAMHEAAIRMARPGMKESEIAAEVERTAVAAGGRLSFPAIATIHGETLHNHDHSHTLSEGDLFLLDAGAESPLGYAADLSSTFPVSKTFDSRQRTIYELQLAAYHTAVDMLAPGVLNRDVHFAAARVIAQGMKDLGLLKGDVDEAVAAGAHAMLFPCGVGHMLGLDAHDMEDLGEIHVGYADQARSSQFGLKSLRLARRLEPGFVITVEPGVYFIPQLMDLWRSQGHCAEYLDFDSLDEWRDLGGVRNEEDFLITADGARRLGPAKPLEVDEIEALRQS